LVAGQKRTAIGLKRRIAAVCLVSDKGQRQDYQFHQTPDDTVEIKYAQADGQFTARIRPGTSASDSTSLLEARFQPTSRVAESISAK
jgi:hypothetical protein